MLYETFNKLVITYTTQSEHDYIHNLAHELGIVSLFENSLTRFNYEPSQDHTKFNWFVD